MGFIADMADLVIPISTSSSNWVEGFDDAESVSIYAPSQLTGTITILASPDRPPDVGGVATASKTSATMQSGGTDITIAAGKMCTITDITFRALSLASTGTESAKRTFKVVKQVYPTASGD